ncbi:VWA domain-containing protein [Hyphococcus flavus]|uniref:VWA domain-containing protein n=1 Tax=Hyphococcus flavus TaxID=1866326 RepID=A0AAE9ZDV3_9PROT|nr:VWA domain-containing protein [Hyphococcus flavus]WDI32746.1 VWA domain-containing protein [Hyphococcus flavus]
MQKMNLMAACALAAGLLACTTGSEPQIDVTEAEDDTVVVTGSRVQGAKLNSSSPLGAVANESYARPVMRPAPEPQITEQYDETDPNPVKLVSEEPVSTFSSDVDTTAYSVMRRYISSNNMLPPSDSVRIEEYVNYFDYQYTEPQSADAPFTPTVWVTPSPWNAGTRLMHIGVKGFDIEPDETPDANIVLLLDVSGSMQAENKLPLVKKSVGLLVDEMSKDDTIAVVVYAGAAGVVLEPTPGNQKTKILEALNKLEAGGSTAGGAGISLAYQLAEENFAEDKVNRIILATDGDFNVGVVDADSLEDFVARKRKTGIYLTILGFGEGNYNDVIAQKLAQAGNGVAAYIDTLNEARKVLVREFRSTLFPIAKDLKFQVEFNPAVVAEYRLIGYETRLLNREDFNNDQIDAGDIGSGHTVTALYELALVGSDARLIDELRYQPAPAAVGSADEFAFVRLRYKLPDENESRLIEQVVPSSDAYEGLAAAPRDARFAAAVAAFGQKLQRAGYTDDYSYDAIVDLAQDAKGDDPFGYRAEFVNLVRAASKIDKENN